MPTNRGAVKLFRLFGISVYLHWAWFVVAYLMIKYRTHAYDSPVFNVLEYLSLFAIVLLHEFGHQLACRQVGGQTHDIVLWPMGGVAYVSPPQRPGAQLWSIVAGPLVNVVLAPVLAALLFLAYELGWSETNPNLYTLISCVLQIDIGLLVFNLLPIYPLDGGQILRSLLWFGLGRGRSLMVTTILGFVGIVGFFGLAVISQSVWIGALGVFMLLNCWGGLQHARGLLRLAKLPRRQGFACPSCRTAPPVGAYWKCGKCEQTFDTFETRGVCPHCSTQYATTMCLDCQEQRPMNDWVVPVYASAGVLNGSIPAR